MYVNDDNFVSSPDTYLSVDDENMGGLAGRFKKKLKKHSPVARLKKVISIAKKVEAKSPLRKIAPIALAKRGHKITKKVLTKVVRKIAPIIPILAFIPVIGTVVALIATTVMVLDKKKQAKLAAQAEGRETAELDRAIAEDEGKIIALQRNKAALESGQPPLTANAAAGERYVDNAATFAPANNSAPIGDEGAPPQLTPLSVGAAVGAQSAANAATGEPTKPVAWMPIIGAAIGIATLLK